MYLANGYALDEIEAEQIIYNKFVTQEKLKAFIIDLLPLRCNVKSVCQAMAVMFMNNPFLTDIDTSVRMLIDLQD